MLQQIKIIHIRWGNPLARIGYKWPQNYCEILLCQHRIWHGFRDNRTLKNMCIRKNFRDTYYFGISQSLARRFLFYLNAFKSYLGSSHHFWSYNTTQKCPEGQIYDLIALCALQYILFCSFLYIA